MNSLAKLAEISREIGADILTIQGPGGNTSYKEENSIYVKSSGIMLKDVVVEKGFTEIDINSFKQRYPKHVDKLPSEKNELDYLSAIHSSKINQDELNASMELGFHVYIPQKWVIHSHSIAGMIYGLISRSEQIKEISDWFQENGIQLKTISCSLPGLQLTEEINSTISEIDENISACWLLKNHGLIWANNNHAELQSQMQTFESLARRVFALEGHPLPKHNLQGEFLCMDFKDWPSFHYSENAMFPDYALFFHKLQKNNAFDIQIPEREIRVKLDSEMNPEIASELLYTQALVATKLKEHSSLRGIPDQIAARISQLATEKARKQQMRSPS